MAWRDWGSTPINSTGAGLTTNPSTSDLIAELTSTNLTGALSGGSLFQVSWVIGASTNAVWQLEHATSTGLGSSAIADQSIVLTPSNQSGQYILTYKINKGERLRCRLQSGLIGFATAKISAEPLT